MVGAAEPGTRHEQVSLTVAAALFAEAYLAEDLAHQGLLLHSVYHRPNGWDYVPPGRSVPCDEATM
jgi:unsaturated chondroitin disaccharide hydrolase